MSVSSPLKTDIRNFLELLQSNPDGIHRRTLSLESDKLSIIYSASEPESSLADKENSRNSSNKSQASNEIEEVSLVFKEIRKTALSFDQETLLNRLEILLDEIKKHSTIHQSRMRVMEAQLFEEKKGTDEILKALVKMDDSQKELWTNYSIASAKCSCLEEECRILKDKNGSLKKENLVLKEEINYVDGIDKLREENRHLKQRIESLVVNKNEQEDEKQNLIQEIQEKHEDIEFMRRLVLVANENYENIERKCRNLQKNTIMFQRFKEQQKSSPEITSKSMIKCNKSSYSPSVSEKSILSARKGSFEENYRRLVLRTLKSKAVK